MTSVSESKGGKSLPVKQNKAVVKTTKIGALPKEIDEFMKKMEKKKAGPGEIASALEQWLDSE